MRDSDRIPNEANIRFDQFFHYLFFSHFLKTTRVLLRRTRKRRSPLAEGSHSEFGSRC